MFGANELVFLGFVLSKQGLKVENQKIKAIEEWSTPASISHIRNLYDLASFFRRFLRDFSIVAAPLMTAIKTNVEFSWGKSQEKAFQKLKHRLTNSPLLVLPDFTKTFEVEYDALGISIRVVLTQGRRLVAFLVRS